MEDIQQNFLFCFAKEIRVNNMNPKNLKETILAASIKELIEIENTLADLVALCQEQRKERESKRG